jgi:hypothetical protein
MKAGYVALFSLVVAYSAYQGTGISSLGSAPQRPKASGDAAVGTGLAHPQSLAAGTEPFPTIGGGLCPLVVREGHSPCGTCKAICPAKGLSGLIEDYFRAEVQSDNEFADTHWNVPQARQANIRFVIASLPDPVHTHMALLFDRGIESIEGAAQASGYLFSRSWMPWDISTHSESADFTVRMAQAHLEEQVESLPGLMIFQGSGGSGTAGTILFVFVVGETPTAGLHVEQMQNALEIRRSILAGATADLPESKVLRIFGPAFSGSLMSLDAILNAQPHDRFSRISIRSGTISSYHAVRDFCESVKSQWSDQKLEKWAQPDHPGRPDFATLQFSDRYQEFYLSVFFYDRHDIHSHVAILSEDETTFGNQEAKVSNPEVSETQERDDGSSEPVVPFIRLYFPREIAQLRDAYQHDVQIQTQATNAKSPPQNGLALSLSVTGNDDDSVAAYSPLQTPLSQESMLQAIVATLRRKHAKVVIIRASDTLDEIFLSRYLRQNYPQARLVTVGADLLMVHDFYDPRFHGILAVTPFPLLTGADFPGLDRTPSGGKEVHRLFPDSYSAGNFNAFLSLLDFEAEAKSGELPARDYEQLGMPSFLQPTQNSAVGPLSAHLWLTSVGRDGYWPVGVLDDVPETFLQNIAKETKREIKRPESGMLAAAGDFKHLGTYAVHFSVAWTIFWMLAFGLTLCMSLLLAFPSTFSRSEILGRFGGNPSPSRSYLLFLGSMLLLASETLFVIPAVFWLGHYGKPAEALGFWQSLGEALNGLWLVIGGYVFSAAALGVACYRGFNDRENKSLARIGVAVCASAIFITIGSTGWMWSADVDSTLGSFLYRYINVGSGVSPCLPLVMLLAGWIWWTWQSLTGVASTQEKWVVLPSRRCFEQKSAFNSKQLLDPTSRVQLKAVAAREDEWPWKTLAAVPRDIKLALSALAGFAVIVLLMRPSEIAEAFESATYKRLYWCLLYSCLLLVCFLVTHIVALWLQLRMLLQAVERLPFRRGFTGLKTLTWKPLWKLAGNGREEFVQVLREELDALTQIQKTEAQDPALRTAIANAKSATDKVSAAYEHVGDERGREATAGLRATFQILEGSLATAASEALLYANSQWKAGVGTPAQDSGLAATERFLCLFYLNIILVPLRRLQTLILALAGVFVSVLISYSSYPFESRESFHVLLISIFFVISLVVGVVYGQMYSNPLLARITNTKPGELGLDFWVRIGTFVFVPLLSLLSVQFPEINNFLFSWLEPALQSIK